MLISGVLLWCVSLFIGSLSSGILFLTSALLRDTSAFGERMVKLQRSQESQGCEGRTSEMDVESAGQR